MDQGLQVKNLYKTYRSKENVVTANYDLSFDINDGEILCVLGHNGAGKTTLIKSICGLVKPDAGDILIGGLSLVQKKKVARDKVGAVLEGTRNLYHYLSAAENMRYFGLLNGLSKKEIAKRSDDLLEVFGLKGRENDSIGSFSRGMQQKVAIMVALMKNPDVLLLDEPTLGLDIISAHAVRDFLVDLTKNERKKILVTTHDISLIEGLSSRIVFLEKGKIVCDSSLEKLRYANRKIGSFSVTLPKIAMKPEWNSCEIVEQDETCVVLKIHDFQMAACMLASGKVIKIESQEASFEDIYRSIYKLSGVV